MAQVRYLRLPVFGAAIGLGLLAQCAVGRVSRAGGGVSGRRVGGDGVEERDDRLFGRYGHPDHPARRRASAKPSLRALGGV
jgi:hypothetical protein